MKKVDSIDYQSPTPDVVNVSAKWSKTTRVRSGFKSIHECRTTSKPRIVATELETPCRQNRRDTLLRRMARNRDPQRERMVRRRERRKIQLRCRVIAVCVRVLSSGSNALTRACSQNRFSLLLLVFAHLNRRLGHGHLFSFSWCKIEYRDLGQELVTRAMDRMKVLGMGRLGF